DVSVLQNYQKPYNTIPSTTVSTQGLTKTMMFDDQLASKGFSNSVWTFRSVEGNYAYYPQLTVFADNKNEQVKDNSVLSVITNPFLGDGTKASPYIINTARDMATLAASITAEYSAEDIYYLVASGVAELDLTAVDFKPIGSNVAPFKGHFDGNY